MIADPFRHVVLDGFWPDQRISGCAEQFDLFHESAWHHVEAHAGSVIVELKDSISFARCAEVPFISELHRALSSPDFVGWVSRLFGIEGLHFDPVGGGVHRILPGGRLYPHVDFNVDAHGRWRRINVLIYLGACNGGALTLFDKDLKPGRVIEPQANRMVIFECSEHSWHGHPTPLGAGPNRKSLAAYYFTHERPADAAEPHDTIFRVA